MGVSLIYRIVSKDGEESAPLDIHVGWRSMMRQLLDDHCLMGLNTTADIPELQKLARDQLRGQRRPPFDWAEDIEAACLNLIAELNEHGMIKIEAWY